MLNHGQLHATRATLWNDPEKLLSRPDGYGSDMSFERDSQCAEMEVAVDAAELGAGFDRPGGVPNRRGSFSK